LCLLKIGTVRNIPNVKLTSNSGTKERIVQTQLMGLTTREQFNKDILYNGTKEGDGFMNVLSLFDRLA